MTGPFLLLLFLGATAASSTAAEPCSATSGPAIKPLVELYTSEGCSSCPPADRWLSAQIGRSDINLLAFHVDYWDSIGWPDRFASPAYSQRQRQRVQAAQGDSVYTPQVIVATAWSSPAGFDKALGDNLRTAPPALTLALEKSASGARATLSVAGSSMGSANIWLAHYLDNQTSEVRAGENRGATLHHDRVVNQLWGPWHLQEGSLSRTLAIDVADDVWGLLAFVQDDTGNTLQSLALPASACEKISNAPDGRR